MKYLTLVEYGPDDMEKVWKTYGETTVVRETNPDKFPKILFEAQDILGELPKLTESFRSFIVHETDDPKQLEELAAFYKSRMPEMKSFRLYFVPITDLPSFVGKTREYRKTSR